MKFLFYGCGAYVGRIDGLYKCGFWAQEPSRVNYDQTLLQSVDLSKSFDNFMDVDSELTEPDVQVGPSLPQALMPSIKGAFLAGDAIYRGGIYIYEKYWRTSLADKKIPWPPSPDSFGYEWQQVFYVTDPKPDDEVAPHEPKHGKRYRGFHAEVRNIDDETGIVSLSIFQGGKSLEANAKPIDKDFAVTDFQDATWFDSSTDEGGCTHIVPDKKKPERHVGALFIEVGRISSLALSIPKLPPGQG